MNKFIEAKPGDVLIYRNTYRWRIIGNARTIDNLYLAAQAGLTEHGKRLIVNGWPIDNDNHDIHYGPKNYTEWEFEDDEFVRWAKRTRAESIPQLS